MKKLRGAIVGAGFISSGRHLPALSRLNGRVEMVALSDLNGGMARAVADQFRIPKVYSDAAEMIVKEKPELVDICTPPSTHAKLAAMSIEQGCHVMIEKPMALNPADCDTIVNMARRRNVKVCVAHTGLFYEPLIKARQLVGQGAIGEFRGMHILLSTPTDYMTSKPDHWAHRLPGGAIGETAPHPVYMSLAFLKGIRAVTVEGVKLLPEYPWSQFEDYRINLLADNGISSISINYATNQWMFWTEIAGSDGTLLLDLHGRCVVSLDRSRLKPVSIGLSGLAQVGQGLRDIVVNTAKVLSGRTPSTHERLIEAFVESIIRDRPAPVTAEDGREAVRVMAMVVDRLKQTCTAQGVPTAAQRA